MKNEITAQSISSAENLADAVIVNGEVFTYKNTGLTRRVFVNADKTFVVKIPTEKYGGNHNQQEYQEWSKSEGKSYRENFAVTELLPNGYIKQEFLHTFDDPTTLDWLGRDLTIEEIMFARSCRNDVGFDKNGNLKCYDLHEYLKY